MRRNHLDAVAAQLLIEWIAVVSAIADQILRLGLDHVEVETELNQTHFVVVGRMRTDRERQAMAVHNRHDFQALSALRRTDLCAAALGHRKGRVDETLFFIQRAALAKLVGDVGQNLAQNLVATPGLEAPMHSFVVRIALRQHVPLRTCVENPQYRFKHMTGRDRLASRTPIGNMLLRKMLPNALPLFVRQPNHFLLYSASASAENFEIASSGSNLTLGA